MKDVGWKNYEDDALQCISQKVRYCAVRKTKPIIIATVYIFYDKRVQIINTQKNVAKTLFCL